ncbi:TetR/AcrR family transcriptional regulator [Williamsia herbipolensis]|uniref:TetR/AcrR family transcriptional regulator n=1 Tax=Williamsia herbipolensis TaxID=1603258 RepID=A0AAU4JZ28_9NOCA|nr:TetR/AcrR family transcriptional regulator [Williamsia herbipolensis]
MTTKPENRLDRRRARTRSALIDAACQLLSTPGGTEASVAHITELADVGLGSFYNHFENKDALFDSAIGAMLELHGRLFDEATSGLDDPAEVFAAGLRMSLRLRTSHPRLTKTMSQVGFRYLDTDDGLAPRAYRDLEAAVAAGRFDIDDLNGALACTAGALLGYLHLLSRNPSRDTESAADDLAASMLRQFGLPKEEAIEISRRPLKQPTLQ